MGKKRYFLGIFASLLITFFVGNALAAGYSCPTYKKYTSCSQNYYLNGTDAGNACVACPSGSGWQSTTSANNTSTSCACPSGYWQSSGNYNVVSGQTCVKSSVQCAAGTYLKANATSCTACPEKSYCPGGTYDIKASDQGINSCPSGYPNSAASASKITQCFSATKSRAWSGTQTACTTPTNCATVECNACSNPACDYVAYSNANGTGDGEIKSGCSTNNAACTQTVKSVTASVGYYINGTSCSQCPEGYREVAAASQNACVGSFKKSGTQQTPTVPTNCKTISGTGTCTVGECTYKKNYAGTITQDCTPTNCTKPITGVTASAGYYASTSTCPACSSVGDGTYTLSQDGNSGETGACYKNCTRSCTQQSCPANASCTHGTQTTNGTQSYGGTCSAASSTCTLSFTCNNGYVKNAAGTACEAAKYTITYKNGGGTGSDQSQQVSYKGTFTTKAASTFSRPGYDFTSWGGDYPNPNSSYTYNTAGDTTLTAQWSACRANTGAAGTCGCTSAQYPNGSGCSNCSVSCSGVSGFTLGTYNVCSSQTNSICYRNCTTADVPNAPAANITGTVTKGGTKTCATTACNSGYYVSGGACAACIPNATCPGGGSKPSCNSGYHFSDDNTSCLPDEYTITLNKNGGTGSVAASQICKHGVLCNLPSSGLTKTGWAFTGWGDNASCTTGVYQMTFTGAKTLYACWSQTTESCQAGKYYNGTSHVECPSGKYCPGTGSVQIGTAGCASDCPAGAAGSDAGATTSAKCYVSCGAKTISGGTATVVNAKEYYTSGAYPTCKYTVNCNNGYKASGNNTANPTCTRCGDGEICGGGTTTTPTECPAGSYCEDGIEKSCPAGGTSAKGAGSITECYKTCPAPGTDAHGTISYASPVQSDGKVYVASASSTTYPACVYSITCTESGYIPSNSPGANPTCVWDSGTTCPAGYYCPPSGGKFQCPDGGTSDAGAAESATDCYKIFDPYAEFENGVASAKCKYLTSTSKYENCSILEVKSCKAGYWYSTPGAFACSGVSSGFYSPDGAITATACPADASGTVESNEYADSFTDCYKTCALNPPHSTSVAAKDNIVYGASTTSYNACSFTITCERGYTVKNNNTANPSCAANVYTITLNKNGGTGSVANTLQCTFDSKSCALPATTGLTRAGYTVAAKWCTTASGATPCYDAGTTITTNISADGTDTTLYAVWTPNVYTVNLDHQGATVAGAPATVYLKYATGWYSNAAATTAISALTKNPTKTGYEFTGYYTTTTGGTQVVGSDGKFVNSDAALTMTTTTPTTIYAKWSAGLTTCDAGEYYTGTGTTCAQCTANNYCPGGKFETDSGRAEGLIACPESGASLAGAESSAACYKLNLPYAAAHGDGTQRCYYDSDESAYSTKCDTRAINLCDAGYYLKAQSDIDCTPVGIGNYSDGTSTTLSQCPNSGSTETTTSTRVQDCFKTALPYTAVYGSGTQRCFYSSGSGASAVYQRDCDTKRINNCRGGYWLENAVAEDCVKVGQGNYSPADDTQRYACENGGDTKGANAETSDNAKLCFKAGQEYIGEHGTGNRVCYYTSGTGANAVYSSSCETPIMTYCDAGYYYDSALRPDDCIAVGIGYYSALAQTERTQCPDDGTTKTTTSAASSDCYKELLDCAISNGAGKQTCNYDQTAGTYSASCTTCLVVACDEGYSQVGNTCLNCPAGSVCNEGQQKTCASMTGGQYTMSDAGTTDVAMCYKNCATAANAAEMTGRDYYGAPDTCAIVRCDAGYKLSNGTCSVCPAGSFCDGTTDPENPGDDIKSCADLGDGSWEFSVAGATDASGCYRKCEQYDVENGVAIPVEDKAFWPNQCQYNGKSDSGNPCDIVNDVCVETSCNNNYEMVNGSCKPCNRENALSYKPNGNCVIASCITGYHPNGQVCEEDIKECAAPNAVYAEHKWDYKLNAFGTCIVKECEDGFHLASNACVSDIQPCTVANGTGVKEWNHATNNWDACVAMTCDAGYTNDPSETNERSKPCGQCKNKFSVLGELAASSYVQGCEIASCMYQGELYNLEGNECVPICDVNGYEDDTGTMKWDPSRKKCVRTCKEGYTMW